MSNGSFLTSQLPNTTTCASTDKFLVLYNSISNGMIGSGTPQTMMMTLSDMINNAINLISTDIMTFGVISVGNSTYNTVINSTSIFVVNSTANIFSVNTSGVINGNGAGLTSIMAAGGTGANTYILYNNSGIIAGSNNLTWNGSSISIGNNTVNTTVNSSVILNGQTYINSTTLSVGNNGTVLVGNATYNTVIAPQTLTVSNNGVTAWIVTGGGIANLQGTLTVGNSTQNVAMTSATLTCGNTLGNPLGSTLTASYLLISNTTLTSQLNVSQLFFSTNTTSNSILTNTSLIFNGNSTSNSYMNSSIFGIGLIDGGVGSLISNNMLTIGNSTINATMNSISIKVVNLFQLQGLGGL